MPSLAPISVIIISHNEEEMIAGCIEAASFAAEIIVLDSGSQDATLSILSEYQRRFKAASSAVEQSTAIPSTPQLHIIETDWPGDGPQRNRGIALAHYPWVLCLDADERPSLPLCEELTQIASQHPLPKEYPQGFMIPFHSHYLGQRIHFGNWYGEKHLRFFRKEAGSYTGTPIYGAQGAHARPVLTAARAPGRCRYPILHYPYRSLSMILEKMDRYSSGGALIKKEQKLSSSLSKALLHGLWTFIRGYLLKAGFLDGSAGFILAFSQAEYCYYRYLKMVYPDKNPSIAQAS